VAAGGGDGGQRDEGCDEGGEGGEAEGVEHGAAPGVGWRRPATPTAAAAGGCDCTLGGRQVNQCRSPLAPREECADPRLRCSSGTCALLSRSERATFKTPAARRAGLGVAGTAGCGFGTRSGCQIG